MEAYYRDVGDLLSLSVRRFCNLVLHWMMEHTDPEVWEKEYRDKFFGDPSRTDQATGLTVSKLKPAVKGQQGSINIKPRAEKEKVTDLSAFLGRVGETGKVDPNKKALAAKAKKARATRITIAPDEGGNLNVDEE